MFCKIKYKIGFVCLASILLSACSSFSQREKLDDFNSKLEQGDYNEAADLALKNAEYDPQKNNTDDLFWTLQAGAALNYAGNYPLSTSLLDNAETKMKQEDKANIGQTSIKTTGAILGNDAMVSYQQTQYDGVMANTIKAWNFIFQHKYQDARIEFNRAEERQRRAAQYFADEIKKQQDKLKKQTADSERLAQKSIKSPVMQQSLHKAGIEINHWQPYQGFINPFTTYSYGLYLLLTAKDKSDFNKSQDLFKRVYGLTKSKVVKEDIDLAQNMAKGKFKSKNGIVWVIFENGSSSTKKEVRLDLPLFLLDNSKNVSYVGFALPKLTQGKLPYKDISVNGHHTQVLSEMDKIIGAEFDVQFPMILVREVTRVTLKTIAQKQLNDVNPLAGSLFAVVQAATNGADIRSFSSLPSQFQVTHFKKPTNNKINIQAGKIKITEVLDEKYTNQIIWIKAVSPKVQPSVKIINF